MSVREHLIRADDAVWHFYEWPGQGDCLHFHHANSYPAGTYLPFLNQLAESFHVYAMNANRTGETRTGSDLGDWHQTGRDLNTFLNDNVTAPLIGAGHSLGAVLTLYNSVWQPELFSHIFLIDPVILHPAVLLKLKLIKPFYSLENLPIARLARKRKTRFENRREIQNRYQAKKVYQRWKPVFLDAYLEYGFQYSEDGSAQLAFKPEDEIAIYSGIPLDVWSYFKKTRVPVTVIRGKQSDTVSDKTVSRMKRLRPDVTIHEIEDAGHLLIFEEPDLTCQLIRSDLGLE